MPLNKIRVGVLSIQLPLSTTDVMGSLNSLTPTVCSVINGPLYNLANDLNPSLSTSKAYQFVIALAGQDNANGGYTVGEASTASLAVTPSANCGIRVFQSASSLAGAVPLYDEAAFMAVFVKLGAASQYTLCKLGYIPNNGDDFEVMIAHEPLQSAPSFTLALLQSTTASTGLGSRIPTGFLYETVTPTTGAIDEVFNVSNVNISPNTGPDYTEKVTQAVGLEFSLLLNDIKSIVRGTGGYSISYNATNGTDTINEGEFGLANAQAILIGNKPVIVTYPADSQGNVEVGIFLGLRTYNDQNLRMAWSKSADTPVQIVYQAAVVDTLLVGQHTKLSYVRNIGAFGNA